LQDSDISIEVTKKMIGGKNVALNEREKMLTPGEQLLDGNQQQNLHLKMFVKNRKKQQKRTGDIYSFYFYILFIFS
jgi:hypothetical protein